MYKFLIIILIMDLSNLYSSIEEMEDKVDKCLLYSEIILYLKDVAASIGFKDTGVQWKDLINKMIVQDTLTEINSKIKELRNFIEFNVKH